MGTEISINKAKNNYQELRAKFYDRVITDGGNIEADACLVETLNEIDTQSPTLILTPNAFGAGTLPAIKPYDGTGDFSVVRATSAWRRNSAGLIESVGSNVPRINYPIGGGCPYWLVEPQRTNLLLRSQEFDNSSWTKINTTPTASVITAPDGTLTADLITGGFGNTGKYINQLYTSSIARTFSCFVKFGTQKFIQILETTNVNAFANFDIELGVAGNTGSLTTSSIEDYGDGWFRVSCTFNIATSMALRIYFTNSNVAFYGSPTANELTTFHLWQAQLEEGSTATSIIPTTAAAVTRNADVISKTGISALIGQTEGTVIIHYENLQAADISNIPFFAISDGSQNNRLRILSGTTFGTLRVIYQLNGNILLYDVNNIAFVEGENKIAFKYKSGDCSVVLNGVILNAATPSITISSPLSFVGFTGENGLFINSLNPNKIKSLVMTDTALTNAEMQQLTTI